MTVTAQPAASATPDSSGIPEEPIYRLTVEQYHALARRTADSEPEPDIMAVRAEAAEREDRHPEPSEVALVVEVAESSLRRDRGTKKRLYARAGIVVYWIVNLAERQIEVYTEPTGPVKKPEYRRRQDYGPADE